MAEIINYDKEADKKIIQENAPKFGFINLLNTLQILTSKNIEEEFDIKSKTPNIERFQKSFSYNLENTYKFINNNSDINNKNLKLSTKDKVDEEVRKECITSSQNSTKNVVKNCVKNSNLNVINNGFSEVRTSCSKDSCESNNSKGSCCDKNTEEHKVKTNHSQLEETEPNVFKPSSLTKHMKINKHDIICIKDFTIKDYNIEELEKSFSRSLSVSRSFPSKYCEQKCGKFLQCPEMIPTNCRTYLNGECDCVFKCKIMDNLFHDLNPYFE